MLLEYTECQSLSFLHEVHQRIVFSLEDCHAMAQAADVFAQPITSVVTWSRSMLMIGMHHDLEACAKHPVRVWEETTNSKPLSNSMTKHTTSISKAAAKSAASTKTLAAVASSSPPLRSVPEVSRVKAAPAPQRTLLSVETSAAMAAPTWASPLQWCSRSSLRLFNRKTYLASVGGDPRGAGHARCVGRSGFSEFESMGGFLAYDCYTHGRT